MNTAKFLYAVGVGIALATLSAAGKSYVDVERLKVQTVTLFDTVKEIKEDVKDIKSYLLKEKQK